jgi:hypothetical protein
MVEERGVAWIPAPTGRILEAELHRLAQQCVEQFVAGAAALDDTPAAIAHGLFVLAQAAAERMVPYTAQHFGDSEPDQPIGAAIAL